MNLDFYDDDDGLDENGFIASPADYIFGLGNKKKKAEKKVKKAEKAIEKGQVKKAERKLAKAEKKLGKSSDPLNQNVIGKIQGAQQKLSDYETKKEQLAQTLHPSAPVTNQQPGTQPGDLLPLDPIAQGAGATIPGSGSLNPTGGGGGGGSEPGDGGEPSGEELMSQLAQGEGEPQKEVTSDQQKVDNETSKSKNTGLIIIIILVAVLAYFYFKKRKK